jgi:hypothetical protein
MAIDTTASAWAVGQFGARAGEVARRVVQAWTDAQQVGTRTQRASGQSRRYAYGSTWSSKYEQMIYQFTEAAGSELPAVEVVQVPKAPYDLVKVNGRLMIPFVLARTLGEMAHEPTLTSDILRVITARMVPPPPAPPTLFDDSIDMPVAVPGPRMTSEAPPAPVPAPAPEEEAAPVFIGCVCNADSEAPLAIWWGTATSIDIDTGTITWSPEQLPLQLATPADGLRLVSEPRDPDHAAAFSEGVPPEVAVVARPRPVAPDAEPQTSDDRDHRPDTAAGDVDE